MPSSEGPSPCLNHCIGQCYCVTSYWPQWHPHSTISLLYGQPGPQAHAINSSSGLCISTVHSVKPLWSVPEVPFCSSLLVKSAKPVFSSSRLRRSTLIKLSYNSIHFIFGKFSNAAQYFEFHCKYMWHVM